MIPICRAAKLEVRDGRETDAEGTCSYVVWSEGSGRWEWMAEAMVVACFVGLLATFPKGNFWLPAFGFFGGLVCCLRPSIWVERIIRFYDSGSVTVPWGLTVYGERVKKLRFKVRDIVNIELVKDGPSSCERYPYGIDLLMRRGETVHLATSLSKTFAVMLVVRLTEALESVKYEATVARTKSMDRVIG